MEGAVFDIVFMDIYVGEVLGIDIAGRLRNEGYDNLLIFSTITPEYAIASYSVKANGYILKPFSTERIESVLDRVLEHYVKDYIRILGEKSERLGTMVQDVFEVSKAASGQLPVMLEELDFGKLLRQTLADMDTQIEKSGLVLRAYIPEEPVMIRADGQRLYRVFQNLLQNALQYSLKGSRIYLSLSAAEGQAQAVVKNTSAVELDAELDFTERFVRGDASRTDGGSGLGLRGAGRGGAGAVPAAGGETRHLGKHADAQGGAGRQTGGGGDLSVRARIIYNTEESRRTRGAFRKIQTTVFYALK